jgi:hypothetical protein
MTAGLAVFDAASLSVTCFMERMHAPQPAKGKGEGASIDSRRRGLSAA